MPTYTYRCEHCNHTFDHQQGFNEANPHTCPNCGYPNRLTRVYKPVGVVFKGSGFYATDHKSGTRAKNGGKPSTEGDSTKSGNGSTETPAADAPAKSEPAQPKPAEKSVSTSAS
jgi:putative FmdB family regulatory protein